MKLRSIFAGALLFALSLVPSLAQVNPGTSQLSPAKGGAPSISATAFPYNVKCDGATNDSAGIAAALIAGNGGVLTFPPGTCLTDPQVISGVYIVSTTFTSGSAVLTGLPSTTNLAVGQAIGGYSVTQTSAIANTSTTVTLNTFWSTANLSAGMSVTGTGIPAATTISSITDVNHIVINNAATATNAAVSLTFSNTSVPSTTIKSVDSATQVTLNANATGSGTQKIQVTLGNSPNAIIAYGTTFKARASSANPLLTLEDTHGGFTTRFSLSGLQLDANSLHGYPLKVHGGQFMALRDVMAINGTSGGCWFSGEPGYGVYSNIFEHLECRNNTGPGVIAKSINNQGNYYIGGNQLIISSQNNSTFGFDIDYANIGLLDSHSEANGTCGFNLDHVIQFDSHSTHIEANPTNPGCAVTSSANTNNVYISGGRTIGSITAGLLTNNSVTIVSSDVSGLPLIYIAGQHYTSTGISIPTGFGLAFGGTTPVDTAINSPASGLAFMTGGSQKWSYQNGFQIGSAPTGGDKGNGTINITGNGADNFDINGVPYAAFTKTLTNTTFDSGGTGNSLQVGSVAVSKGQFPGTATNDNATAGNVGEFPSSDIVIGSAVALTTATPANITSISLPTAGDWEVSATCGFTGGATTTVTALNCSMSTTSATLDTSDGRMCSQGYSGFTLFNNINVRMPCGPARFSVSGATTVFLVDQTAHAVSTASGFGLLRARRAR